MSVSRYHQSVLEAFACSGVCTAQQLGEAEVLFRGLTGKCAVDAPQIWRHTTARILLPSHDFAVHVRLAAAVYDVWPVASLGRPPLWLPDPDESTRTNVARFLQTIQVAPWWQAALARQRGLSPSSVTGGAFIDDPAQVLLLQWRLLQAASWEDPEGFWPAVLRELGIRFVVPPEKALKRHPTDPDQCRWLPGARLNIAQCALECTKAPPGAPALLWAPDGAPRAVRPMGREELRARVRRLAAGIRRHFKIGDALALYLPMTPSAVCLYLAAVLAGCVVVSVADSFSAEELRTRLDIAGAVGLFTQDVVLRGGKALPLYDKVVKSGTAARAVVLPAVEEDQNEGSSPVPISAISLPPPEPAPLRKGDLLWQEFLSTIGRRRLRNGGVAVGGCAWPEGRGNCNCGGGSGSTFSATEGLRELRAGGGEVEEVAAAAAAAEEEDLQPHVADVYDITNVLFSSGTTGEPKAIPWSHLTPLRCAVDAWAHLDIRPGSVVAWPTSLGWMMGPWLLYGAMLNGATVALYGGPPLGPDFLQFVEAARVDVLGLVPSIVRAWRHNNGGGRDGGDGGGGGGEAVPARVTNGSAAAATDGVDLSHVRVFGSTGEASAVEDYAWLMSRARGYRPVIEYCGGTEIGGGYVSGTLLHPCAPATFTTATLGTRMVLLQGGEAEGLTAAEGAAAAPVWDGAPCRGVDRAGHAMSISGEVALAMPMLGVSQRLLNKDHYKVYYAGMPVYGSTGLPLRRHGDEMAALPAAGPGPAPWAFCALGRCDDTMNLGGIKVSSVELERAVVEGVASVMEAAAVGLAPPQGGPEELTLFLVLRPPVQGDGSSSGRSSNGGQQQQVLATLQRLCQAAVRTRLNPLFKVSRVVLVASLPRNASNKVMRRVLRDALVQLPSRAKL